MNNNRKQIILGAIAGDIFGSIYEFNNLNISDFNLFNDNCKITDDTVLTIAIADSLLNNSDFKSTLISYGRKYSSFNYGPGFLNWLYSEEQNPYNSYGNGSAMRVSAIGALFNDIKTVLLNAKKSAEITHNHPEGIKGAQAIAAAIYLAKSGKNKNEIKDFISSEFNYDLNFTLDKIRSIYKFDLTCQGTVPQSIVAFLESESYENAIKLAISIGGDSDTIACMTGGIASAYYNEIPSEILEFVLNRLPLQFKEILEKFENLEIHNNLDNFGVN
jgi:ADP-ribosylglycohydrolase